MLSSRFLPPAFFRATHSSSSGFLAPSLPTCKPHGCLHTCPAEGSAGWTPVSGCIFLSWRDAPAKLAGLFRFHPVYGIIGTASSFWAVSVGVCCVPEGPLTCDPELVKAQRVYKKGIGGYWTLNFALARSSEVERLQHVLAHPRVLDALKDKPEEPPLEQNPSGQVSCMSNILESKFACIDPFASVCISVQATSPVFCWLVKWPRFCKSHSWVVQRSLRYFTMVMKTKGTARRDLFVYHAQPANLHWTPNFSSLWSFSVNACRIWRVPTKLLSTLMKSRRRYDCQGGFISETPSRCSCYSSERSLKVLICVCIVKQGRVQGWAAAWWILPTTRELFCRRACQVDRVEQERTVARAGFEPRTFDEYSY